MPGPRRVLMTADTVGGVFSYALLLCRGLAHRGLEVTLATMGAPLSYEQRAALRSIPRLRVCESDYQLEWQDDPWHDVARAGDWLLGLAGRQRPDVVHLNGYCHGALPFEAPVVVVGHSCVLSWWRAVLGHEAPARYDPYRRAVRDGLAGASVVVAPTAAMLASLERDYGPFAATAVVANGLDLPSPPMTSAEREPFIVAAGRLWDEAKGMQTLAEVAPLLPWPVHLAGQARRPDGKGEVVLEGVRLHGQLGAEALGGLMRRAAIFVHAAFYEPFGMAPLEAAAAGCALVLSDLDSLHEIWSGAALFVPPGQPKALREALGQLIGDPCRRQALALRAARRARRYGAAAMADGYVRVYERALQSSGPRALQAGGR